MELDVVISSVVIEHLFRCHPLVLIVDGPLQVPHGPGVGSLKRKASSPRLLELSAYVMLPM